VEHRGEADLDASAGILQLDASSHLSGIISGFHLGEEIELRGLAFSSSSSTLTWKQTTSGANASGTLTVKEGTSSTTLTLVGASRVDPVAKIFIPDRPACACIVN
jgi:hypothetical protein